jgi:PAS domain S-box-containing protein
MRDISSWDSIFHPDDMPKFKNFLGNLLKTGDSSTIECRTSVKGKDRWILLTGKPQKDPATGRITSILGAVKDISDKKQIEESIKQSEEKYRTLIERLNTGIFMTTVDGKFIHVNSSLVEITKYGSVEELLNLPVDKLYADKSYRNKFVKEISDKGYVRNMEVETVNKDGSNSWMSISASLIYDNAGKPLSILGTGFDITENKKTKKSLHFNELLLNESQHLAKIGSWVWDLGEKTLTWSNEVYHIFGVKPGDFKPSAETFESMIHPEDRESFIKQRSEMLDEKQSVCIDHRIVLPEGEIKYVQERTSLVMESGKVVRVIGTVQDITEQKRNEQLMKHNEEKYRILVENLNDVIFTINPEGNITYVSPRLNAITGFDPDDLIGKQFNKIIYGEDIDSLQKSFEKVLTNKTRSSEFRYVRKDGNIHWARTSSRPLVENGEITGVYGIFSDITEKKIYEQALIKSESQLSGAMMMARLGPWEYDVLKDEFTFNDAFYAMLKTTAEEVGGYVMKSKDYADRFLHPDDRVLVGIETRKALDTTDPNYTSQLSHRIIYNNGELGYLNVRIFIVKDENKKTIKTYGFNQDITEQKKAENEIQKLLDDRELLLTEVHHRIKNDMNIICSMLMIQIDSCDNPVIKNVLMETEVRINVMFNIYNELYMGKEFNYISLKTYITNLISNIKYIYSDQCYTVMNIDIDDIPINRKISFPIGMIINELLTNSYKYAFFNRKSYNNTITVTIHKKENGDIIVIAGDNGKGFPENILNNERPGFGLKLINMLSKQINGNIKLYNDNGACFEMYINAEFT